MVNRADVAKAAGVSESTVSYVLSGTRPISPETRERVLATMDQLGYIPNAMARGLAANRTGILALHFPVRARGLSLTEFEYIFAATQAARDSGRHLMLWTNPVGDVDELRTLARQGLVDGVLLMEVEIDDPRVPVLRAAGVPHVLIGRTADEEGTAWVDSDFDRMASLAVEHLAGLGHRELAFVGDGLDDDRSGYGALVRLHTALGSAASSHGLVLRTGDAAATIRAGRAALDRLLTAYPQVSAVLSFHEQTLVGVVEQAGARGLSVPGDLSVVCLGVSPSTAEVTSPALTSVSPPGADLGRQAVELLVGLLDGTGDPTPHALLEPSLFARASSGPHTAR